MAVEILDKIFSPQSRTFLYTLVLVTAIRGRVSNGNPFIRPFSHRARNFYTQHQSLSLPSEGMLVVEILDKTFFPEGHLVEGTAIDNISSCHDQQRKFPIIFPTKLRQIKIPQKCPLRQIKIPQKCPWHFYPLVVAVEVRWWVGGGRNILLTNWL